MPSEKYIDNKIKEACEQFSKDVAKQRELIEKLYNEKHDLTLQLKEKIEQINHLKDRLSTFESGLERFRNWINERI